MFYKLEDGQIKSSYIVSGDGFLLIAEEKDSYTYPINGWYWFNTEEEAIAKLII